ncbi:MAG TPA: lipid kinase, partial [Burkholderiaceae bacterium]|nr:lipid kinase [Burkholderiaceae bacterium]
MKKILAAVLLTLIALPAFAQTKYRVAWSHYTGWEPWGYAQQAGILQKWGKKYGIDIELTLV